MTSLSRRAQANAPAASYWLCRVMEYGGRQVKSRRVYRERDAGSESALHHCLVVDDVLVIDF